MQVPLSRVQLFRQTLLLWLTGSPPVRWRTLHCYSVLCGLNTAVKATAPPPTKKKKILGSTA